MTHQWLQLDLKGYAKINNRFLDSPEAARAFAEPYYKQGLRYTYTGTKHLRPDEKSLNRAIQCFEHARSAFSKSAKWRSEAVACWGLGVALYCRAILRESAGWKGERLQKDYRSSRNLFELSLKILKKFESKCGVSEDQSTLWDEFRNQVKSDLALVTQRVEARQLVPSQETFHPAEQEVSRTEEAHPILAEIAAGLEKPISDEDIKGYFRQTGEFQFEIEGQELEVKLLKGTRPPVFLPGYDYFAVRVSGDSMDKAGIAPNDYVVLRKSKPDTSGDIVAVVFRDEDDKATLKRFYFDRPAGSVVLKPESSNPLHRTRILPTEVFAGDSPSVDIVGTAIAVLKPKPVPLRIPIIDEISAGKERPASDDVIGYVTAVPVTSRVAPEKDKFVSNDDVKTRDSEKETLTVHEIIAESEQRLMSVLLRLPFAGVEILDNFEGFALAEIAHGNTLIIPKEGTHTYVLSEKKRYQLRVTIQSGEPSGEGKGVIDTIRLTDGQDVDFVTFTTHLICDPEVIELELNGFGSLSVPIKPTTPATQTASITAKQSGNSTLLVEIFQKNTLVQVISLELEINDYAAAT